MATHPRTRGRTRAPYDRRGAQRPVRPDMPVYDAAAPPPPPPDNRGGWREEVASLSALNVVAGIWLIIAPWVLNYAPGDPKWNDVVFGAIVAFLAFVKIGGAYRSTGISILNAAIGVWLFIAAFTIDATSTASWNDIILGVIVFVLAIGSAGASERAAGRPAL